MMSAQRVTHNPLLINDAAWPAPRLYLNLPTDTHKHNGLHKHARTMHTYIDTIAPVRKERGGKKKNLWYERSSACIRTQIHNHKHAHVWTYLMYHASKRVWCRTVSYTHINTHHHVLMDGALVLSLDLTFSDSIIRNYSPLSPWPRQ